MTFRITIDTGGTFTDVIVSDASGRFYVGKALTTPGRSFVGLFNGLTAAAEQMGCSADEVLKQSDLMIFGTTRATNAIVTRATAKTAFLTTEGFPDILVLKEGGKFDPHDFSVPFPEPYIPRRHTFEISGRIDAEGGIVSSLDESRSRETLREIGEQGFEAIAVCLVWSIANPEHELAVGELIEEELPGLPYTLSHQLIPILREYRRASTTAIDASLKPLMRDYLNQMESDLRSAGFDGELLISTSVGGCMHVHDIARRPVHAVKSGPAMAPVAGRVYAQREGMGADLIVCDAGGTTFDVGLVRGGELVFSRDTWLGQQWLGDLVSMSTVDVRSVGAGGGSIAWVDVGGLLRVGPQSAGSDPGPACYGRGGLEPTVTDAAVVLGYIDPEFFVGGAMPLDVAAARNAITRIGKLIGRSAEETAFGIMSIANELMIRAIQEITVEEGIDPRESLLIAGGGAAGLNIFPIAQELGCTRVLLPSTASALSACGMQFADIVAEQSASFPTRSDDFDLDGVRATIEQLKAHLASAQDFAGTRIGGAGELSVSVEARYEFQVWDLEFSIENPVFVSKADVDRLVNAFHETHERIFAVRDTESVVEFVNWKARRITRLDHPKHFGNGHQEADRMPDGVRGAYFGADGWSETPIYKATEFPPGFVVSGPAIMELPTTTIVVYPGMRATISESGHFHLHPETQQESREAVVA
ncbi:MAG: hydantoinase/oxoprolinase family protein [Hyphomicrobiaceae bacterium]|nr:hydantoinase/oxoprolinase family protein [Hyphomicrobiaceae bacterium]